MSGLEYVRLLRTANPDSEVWWDASPVCYWAFKFSMVQRYPELSSTIESLLSASSSVCNGTLTGATTNPRLINAALFQARHYWAELISNWGESPDVAQRCRDIYNRIVQDAAAELALMWECSGGRFGWLSAQVDPLSSDSTSAMVEQGLELSGLAPNIMVKVPGSEAGYCAIEQLVAKGCSINNTFCFTVSQFAAGLKAIERGRASARRAGRDIAHARYVITFMIGRFGAEPEFQRQAQALGLELTAEDKRWAELAVYDAIQTLLNATQSPIRLLLCSIKLDKGRQQVAECWHLEKTGERTTLYTLPAPIIEFLLRRERAGRPITPARSLEIPHRVLDKLLRIDYFRQAWQAGGFEP